MRLEFDRMEIDSERIKNMQITFRKDIDENPIFHYTSIGGLQGIVSKGMLRFTNIKYMNDRDEVNAGLESIAKAYGISKADFRPFDFMDAESQNFVCCFSLEQDSLPMWNYYTKEINNQGYNIEFDDKTLVESILYHNPCLNGCNIAFGMVDYSESNDSKYSTTIRNATTSSLHFAFSSLCLAINKNNQKKLGIDESIIEECEKQVADAKKKSEIEPPPIYGFNGTKCSFDRTPLENYVCFIKRDCFKQEREFRVVISVPNDQLDRLKEEKVYSFRIGNGALIPQLELKFSVDVIKSITISPTVQSDLVEQSIKDFTTYCGLHVDDYTKFIKKSNVPVRF